MATISLFFSPLLLSPGGIHSYIHMYMTIAGLIEIELFNKTHTDLKHFYTMNILYYAFNDYKLSG